MKRISNIFIRFFVGIARFFDRIIITPITKLFVRVYDLFSNNGKGFEKFITHRQSLVIISLLFALIAFYAVEKKHISLVDSSAEILYGKPVVVDYNEALYVVEGVPETADITLVGGKWNVYLAKQYPIDGVTLDLNGLSVGTHTVSFKYEQAVSSVKYKVDPSSVNITIYDKISETRELSIDYINKDVLDSKLNIDSVVLSRDNVIVKGAKHQLAEVSLIKAMIDIENLGNTKEGSKTLENIPLMAYDKNGNKLKVEIVPATIDATIKVTSPSKEVPIKLVSSGELDGKAIKSLTSSVSTVMIYGSEGALANIEFLPVTVDVNGVSENRKYNINLVKPSGVREISVKTIEVELVVDEIVSRDIKNVKIDSINVGSGLKVSALSAEDSAATVIVNGSKSVIDLLEPSAIKAYIDVAGLGVGEHEVDVKVSGNDTRISYASRVKKVRIVISKK